MVFRYIAFDGKYPVLTLIIAGLVMECHIAVNIMYADTRDVNGKAFGQMILQLPEDRLQQDKAIYYLQSKNLRVEEVNGNGH